MKRLSPVILALLVIFLPHFALAQGDESAKGPFFGNGFHSGWADQDSIVLWTRLTSSPEGLADGEPFITLSKQEAAALDKDPSKEKIHEAQIPQGLTLDDMIGACPGAEGEVRLTYHPVDSPDQKVETEWSPVDPTKNFTHQWALENLQPGTRYAVTLEARPDQAATGPSATLTGFFQTAPAAESTEPITFTVVTCHDYIRTDHPEGHRIYKSMLDLNPDFYVHTGDIEYYDKPDPWAMTEELMYFKWDRLFALPLQRHFWTQVTSYFMKDDHDTLDNDCSPGDTYGTVTWDRGLEIFDEEQFPTHDPSYKTIRWGKDLQIWLTEGRTYRSQNSAPDGPDKTIFGQEQLDWLFSTLQESDATFKVVINANPVVGPDRGGKKDNYANSNFSHEGQEIRDFINELDNVYLCNGDRHWQYVSNPPGTNLWEFSCGPGADKHAGGWNPNDTRPEHKFLRVKGGFLKVSVEPAGDERPAKIVFEHCDVEGNVVNREEFTPASK